MLCPNCGNDNPSVRTVCSVCGADLRTVELGTIDAPPREGSREDFENSLWPPETVFIFEDDAEELLEVPAAPLGQFDDAQADDVFEQSLSGVKLEDLIEDEEEAAVQAVEPPTPEEIEPLRIESPPIEPRPAESVAKEAATPERITEEAVKPVIEVPIFETPVAILTPEPGTAPDPEPISEAQSPTRRGTGRRILKAAALVLTVAFVFGSGAATGFWYAVGNARKAEAAREAAPPEPPKPAIPAAPDGMVHVPGGDFLMGSDDAEELSRPAHFVSVRPFFIDRTEVTNEAYRRFVEATNYDPPSTWKDGAFSPGEEQMPVTGVTWYDAAAYAAWAGKRLPTEAEWEFAARGAEGRKYPWGNDWDATLANLDNNIKALRRVGEGTPSPLGVFDLAGNAWEWTASDARAYPGSKEFPRSRLKLKIIRGGNWKSNQETAAATFRGFYGASGEKDYSSTSFRCVKDITN